MLYKCLLPRRAISILNLGQIIYDLLDSGFRGILQQTIYFI